MRRILVVLVIIIVLLAAGIVIYNQTSVPERITLKKSIIPTTIPAESPTDIPFEENQPSITLPIQIVQNYYDAFDTCMKNPPSEASGKVQVYCQDHNAFAGSKLASNLDSEAKKGYIPVICAQEPPTEAKPKSSTISGETNASVLFTETFGMGNEIDITYELVQEGEGNAWKIENIICPRP